MYQLLVLSANNQQLRPIEQQLKQAAATRNAQLFTGEGKVQHMPNVLPGCILVAPNLTQVMANTVFASGAEITRMPQSKLKIGPDERQLFIYAYSTVDVTTLRDPIFALADAFDLYHVLRLRGGDWALGAAGKFVFIAQCDTETQAETMRQRVANAANGLHIGAWFLST